MRDEVSSNLGRMSDAAVTWANSAFPNRTAASAFLKLYEEIGEMVSKPHDGMEYADVMIMLVDLANMYGVDLVSSFWQKLEINRNRNWEISELGTMKHSDEMVIEQAQADWIEETRMIQRNHDAYVLGQQHRFHGSPATPEAFADDPSALEWYMSGYDGGVHL